MTSGTLADTARATSPARQRIEFRTGNEAAAIAARAAGVPLSPAIAAEELALGYGAALGGARVLALAGSHAVLGSFEQLCVQSAARLPLVLNLAAHAAPGTPGRGCEHSGLYHALDAGWIVLCARDPQAVYDLNLAAVRIGEHPDVRLPVLIAYDTPVTSHEKRRVHVIDDAEAVTGFLGARPQSRTPLDVEHPATFGAPMAGAALLENQSLLAQAMQAARRVIAEVFAELEILTGRAYPAVDAYEMQDAEAAVVLLNTAAEVAKEAAEVWRGDGRKVGVLSPNVLRPFPADEFRELLDGVKGVTAGDRAGAYGAEGRLATELRAAISNHRNGSRILARIFGADFDAADAERLLDAALHAALHAAQGGEAEESFAYHISHDGAAARGNVTPDAAAAAQPNVTPEAAAAATTRGPIPAVRGKDIPGRMAKVRRDESTGRLHVELEPLWKMTSVPSRVAPGHRACPGCGVFPMLRQVFNVLEGDVVVLFESGCALEVSAEYPSTAHRINFVHNLAGSGAATLAGLVEAHQERVRRAELPPSSDLTFVMVTGDGGMDADLAGAIAMARRNPRMIVLEYDNQGRMSADVPRSRLPRQHDDHAQLFAACHIPYVFTAAEAHPEDLMRKVAKAQWYARNEGMVYGKVLSFCPLHWETADDAAQPVLQAALDSAFFPLYEVECGHTTLTYDPDAMGRRKPVAAWLKLMGTTAHLLETGNAAILAGIQAETDRRWARLKVMHAHPLL